MSLIEYITIYTLTFLALFSNGIFTQPSSQIIYLSTGYFLNSYSYLEIFLFIIFASFGNACGNYILYYIFYYEKRSYMNKFLKLFNTNQEEISKKLIFIKQKPFIILILGKMTPSIKVFIPALAGLAKIKPLIAFVCFFIGSFSFALIFILIGYYFGDKVDLKTFYITIILIYILIFVFIKNKKYIIK
ncbi:MAG: VTT domain-containing protein [Patescibacteria group bacterium]|nr:VTT domain-containing protein [Patescibacteria group bacterium]